jgi:hypothetical protein
MIMFVLGGALQTIHAALFCRTWALLRFPQCLSDWKAKLEMCMSLGFLIKSSTWEFCCSAVHPKSVSTQSPPKICQYLSECMICRVINLKVGQKLKMTLKWSKHGKNVQFWCFSTSNPFSIDKSWFWDKSITTFVVALLENPGHPD